MSMLRMFVLIALGLASAGMTPTVAAEPVRPVATLKIRAYGNHLFLKARINGSEPLDFVLDTGASDYGLNLRTAKSINLALKPLDQHESLGTGEGDPSISVVDDVSFRVGEVELPHKVAYAVAFDQLEERLGHRIDGVIGADLFDTYVVEIDYALQVVRLFDRSSYHYSGNGAIIPLTFSDGRPFARASVSFGAGKPLTGSFIIDTGDGSAVGLNSPFAKSHGLPAQGEPVLADVTFGIAGQAQELRGRASELRLGDVVVHRPVVAFAQATSGSTADASYDGSIGGEVLRRFKVVFDYSRKQMIVERGAGFGDPFDIDMSGLSLVARRPEYAVVEVSRVSDGSPAARAGLVAGDRLVALNGRSVAQMDLATLETKFKGNGRKCRVTIKRGDRTFGVTLVLRRRI